MAVEEKADLESKVAAATTVASADATRRIDIDAGEEDISLRKHWYQLWCVTRFNTRRRKYQDLIPTAIRLPKNPPPPSPPSLDDAKVRALKLQERNPN